MVKPKAISPFHTTVEVFGLCIVVVMVIFIIYSYHITILHQNFFDCYYLLLLKCVWLRTWFPTLLIKSIFPLSLNIILFLFLSSVIISYSSLLSYRTLEKWHSTACVRCWSTIPTLITEVTSSLWLFRLWTAKIPKWVNLSSYALLFCFLSFCLYNQYLFCIFLF